MKAGIFDPYLDTLGGGEKYCLTLAEFLLKSGWEVDLFWERENLRQKIEERWGVNIDRVNFVSIQKNLLKKMITQRKYDLLFWLSDGSVPFMFAKKNILHFQVPFKKVSGKTLVNRIKLKNIFKIVCNSQFTKRIIDERYDVRSEVIYPPVEIGELTFRKEQKLIINVGRFSRLLQEKRQDLLIGAFKKLLSKTKDSENWKLILAGGSDIGGKQFVKTLKNKARGYPIEILENISAEELKSLYAQGSFFWAANGFGVDEEKNPEKVEHFGIAIVEAMSNGVIPILTKKGGFKEIVEDEKSGFFWESVDRLVDLTLKLRKRPLEDIRQRAYQRSLFFSKEKFYERIGKIIF